MARARSPEFDRTPSLRNRRAAIDAIPVLYVEAKDEDIFQIGQPPAVVGVAHGGNNVPSARGEQFRRRFAIAGRTSGNQNSACHSSFFVDVHHIYVVDVGGISCTRPSFVPSDKERTLGVNDLHHASRTTRGKSCG
jgi:hypothetical protein